MSRVRVAPGIGSPVWWAPKAVGLQVTAMANGSVVAQGGPIVRNVRGREVPRWTLSIPTPELKWDPDLGLFIVGSGQTPVVTRSGIVLCPEPVAVSGQMRGSFAPNTEA